MDEKHDKLKELFDQTDPEVKKVVLQVFKLENDKLYMGKPHGIVDDIVDAIKQIVQ